HFLVLLISLLLFPFLFVPLPPPRPTLFPYTTLFRSHHERHGLRGLVAGPDIANHGAPGGGRRRGTQALHDTGSDQDLRRWCQHRSEEHTSELQSRFDLVCRLLLEKKNKQHKSHPQTL